MACYTSKLNLYKANPQEDGESTFNIDTMLNENWDKIDQNAGETSGKLGNLSQLQTTDKSSLVSANNEIKNNLVAHLNDYTQFKDEMTQPDTLTTPKQIYPIINLPNAIDGQASVEVEGRTYVNLLGDTGDFENTTLGWDYTYDWCKSGNGCVLDESFALFGSKSLQSNGDNSVVRNKVSQKNGYYFISGYVFKKTGSVAIYAYNYDCDTSIVATYGTTTNSWERIGLKVNTTSGLGIVVALNDNTVTQNNADGIMVNEITEDEYNNLTVDELMQKYPYISSTKSTTNTRIKSVGKNLLRVLEQGTFNTVTGNLENSDIRIRTGYIKVKPYQKYIVSCDTSRIILRNIAFYDANKKFIKYLAANPLTSDANEGYVVMVFSKLDGTQAIDVPYALYSNIQLEEGTTTTPYEPYKESISYITLPEGVDGLHSLPNGVKDEVAPDGKFIKRVKEYVLQESDITTLGTNFTNFDVSNISKPSDMVKFPSNSSGQALLEGYITGIGVNSINFDSPQHVNMLVASTGVSATLIITYPKGTYANLSEIQSALAGTKLIYQLAEPQIYDLAITPVTCFKDGTIYIESADDAEEYVVPETQFTYPVNTAGVIQSNVEGLSRVDKVVDDLNHQYWRRIDLLTNGIEITSTDYQNPTIVPLSEPYSNKKIYAAECRVETNDSRQSQFIFFKGHEGGSAGDLLIGGWGTAIYTARRIYVNSNRNAMGFFNVSGVNATSPVYIKAIYVVKEVI